MGEAYIHNPNIIKYIISDIRGYQSAKSASANIGNPSSDSYTSNYFATHFFFSGVIAVDGNSFFFQVLSLLMVCSTSWGVTTAPQTSPPWRCTILLMTPGRCCQPNCLWAGRMQAWQLSKNILLKKVWLARQFDSLGINEVKRIVLIFREQFAISGKLDKQNRFSNHLCLNFEKSWCMFWFCLSVLQILHVSHSQLLVPVKISGCNSRLNTRRI